MTGFDQKSVTLTSEGATSVEIEVDVLGNGQWRTVTTLSTHGKELATYSFPAGFHAHWVRGKV